MNFHFLHQGYYEDLQECIEQLHDVCKQQSANFIVIDNLETDCRNIVILGKTDLLYNTTRNGETFESLLPNKQAFISTLPNLCCAPAKMTQL